MTLISFLWLSFLKFFLTTAGFHSRLSCSCCPSLGLWSLCYGTELLLTVVMVQMMMMMIIKAGLKRKRSNTQQSVTPVIMKCHTLHILHSFLREHEWECSWWVSFDFLPSALDDRHPFYRKTFFSSFFSPSSRSRILMWFVFLEIFFLLKCFIG